MKKIHRTLWRVFLTLTIIVTVLMLYHFRADVFPCPYAEYVLDNEMDTINASIGKNVRVLFSQVPQLESNVQRQMEESFWRRVSRDTLKMYSWYSITYYRESESLTPQFKECDEYPPPNLFWGGEIMEWSNHSDEQLGVIAIERRKDGTIFYSILIWETRYGFNWFGIARNLNSHFKEYNSLEELPFQR